MKTLLAIALLFVCSAAMADIAVIVHKDNAEQLSESEIKALYLGKRVFWSSGDKALLVTQSGDTSTCQSFNRVLLDQNNVQFKSHWSRLIFAGRAEPPKEFSSDKKVMSFVANENHAIGYVNAKSVDDSVRVIAILK